MTKNNIVLYINPSCFFCTRAMELLNQKDQQFHTIDVVAHPVKKDEMIKLANGRTTTPQIFINDKHIGGCDDLYDLENNGELDKLLGL